MSEQARVLAEHLIRDVDDVADGHFVRERVRALRVPRRRQVRLRLELAVLVTAAATCSPAHGQATLEIVPSSPRYQEPVYARLDFRASGYCLTDASVSMNESTLSVTYTGDQGVCRSAVDVELGRFPVGNYMVTLLNPREPPIVKGFTVSPRFAVGSPRVDYSGMWWNPTESGWGLSISHGPTHQFFAAWFVYDAAGVPTWYTLESGGWSVSASQTIYDGRVYRYSGPYLGSAFDPAKVAPRDVGMARVTFGSATSGSLTYSIEGVSGFKTIARLPIE